MEIHSTEILHIKMSLFRGFSSIFRRLPSLHSTQLRKISTYDLFHLPTEKPVTPKQAETDPLPQETDSLPQETEPLPQETEPSPQETEPLPEETEHNFLIRNLVQRKRHATTFPTAMVVHLMGRVVETGDSSGKTRGLADGTFAKFYLVTGHKSPDGAPFTQRHRLVAHRDNKEVYDQCQALQRNDIAQISGELNYRYYFERKIGMYVPYTEILPNRQRYVDTRENMDTQGESGMY